MNNIRFTINKGNQRKFCPKTQNKQKKERKNRPGFNCHCVKDSNDKAEKCET